MMFIMCILSIKSVFIKACLIAGTETIFTCIMETSKENSSQKKGAGRRREGANKEQAIASFIQRKLKPNVF